MLRVQVISGEGDQNRLLAASRRGALPAGTSRCRAFQFARAQVSRVAPCATRQGEAHRVGSCRDWRPRPSSPRHSEPRPRQSVRGDPRSSPVPDHTTHTPRMLDEERRAQSPV